MIVPSGAGLVGETRWMIRRGERQENQSIHLSRLGDMRRAFGPSSRDVRRSFLHTRLSSHGTSVALGDMQILPQL